MTTAQITPHRLYGVSQAAEILGVAPSAVRQFIDARKLPARRARRNSHPRIPGAALIQFLGLTVPQHGNAENN